VLSSELSESEEKLLEFLTSRGKDGDQVRFSISEALDQLKISREKLDETLLGLESKDFIKIIKISPSERLISEIKEKLTELDYSLIAGELSREEYLRKREDIIGILSLIPKELEEFTPLPPATIANIVDGLKNSCSHLKGLAGHKEELNSSMFEELRKTYEETLKSSVSLLNRYANVLSYLFEKTRSEIERLENELKALSVDEKIRETDLSIIKNEKSKKLDEAREKLRHVAKALFLENAEAKALPVEEVEKLKEEIKKLELDLKVINARILVEGSTDLLIRRRSKIEDRIKEIKNLLESAKATETSKKGFESSIDDMTRELEELKKLNLVEENVYKLAIETLSRLKKSYEEIVALSGGLNK